ncbi:BZIP domain-containing protein [Aphelenchoides bicaudatus]|nr:BZIP domain-containing protein [Aphelenchoides bicaudatus]
MSRDLQDVEAAPAGICILIEDNFNVFKGLVGCSNDVESGVLEPFNITDHYNAYVLNLDNNYYSTQIQVHSFETLAKYIEWSEFKSSATKPSALFICVDVEMSEVELQEYLEKMNVLNIEQFDSRALLLFGTMPCPKYNVDHPKAQHIQKFVEKHYIETVKFEPNEDELFELEENSEIYGIKRVWELLNVAEWPSKIMKKGVGRFDSTTQAAKPKAVPSSISQKCNATYLTTDNRPSHCQHSNNAVKAKTLTEQMKPTPEDERFIYNFLMSGTKEIAEPDFKVQKLPPASAEILDLQRDQARKEMNLPKEDRMSFSMATNQIRNNPLHTEATLIDRSNINTQMSIINTNKQFEPEKESRAGSTSINVVASTTAPLTTEQVSIVQQSKNKNKSKKQGDDSSEHSASPNQASPEQISGSRIKEEFERIFDEMAQNEEKAKQHATANESSTQGNINLNINESEPISLTQHLAPEINKMHESKNKPETKKDK